MPPASLRRDVGSSLVLRADGPTSYVLAVAVAEGVPTTVESLRVRLDDVDVTRFHDYGDKYAK